MKIYIYDTTLRDGEQTPGVRFRPAQKLDIARRLAGCGVDVIEAGFPASSEGDFEAVHAIAAEAGEDGAALSHCTVSALARLVKNDIDRAAEALAPAKHKRLHIFIATSDIHLKYKLNLTREEALERIRSLTSYSLSLGAFDEIEFSAEDATRTDPEFLKSALTLAASLGAKIINIPDTVGYTTPEEFSALISDMRRALPDDVKISVHCHNDLGMATANSLAALEAGAEQIECTVNGLGERAGNAAMEEVVMAMKVRSDRILSKAKNPPEPLTCSVNTREISETSRLVASISGVSVSPNKAIVGKNAFAHASGIHQHGVMNSRQTYEIMRAEDLGLVSDNIVLGKLSGKHAFAERVRALGYSLDESGIERTFVRFKEIADKKTSLTDDDIRAIIGEYLDSVDGRYKLVTFQIQSGNRMSAMALVTLDDRAGGCEKTEAAPGSGPIDAAFNAINRIAGLENADGISDAELVSYGITAVTEGTDALGEAKVNIKYRDNVFAGKGVSTDIIKASIKAYLGAVNKISESHHAESESHPSSEG